MTVFSLYACTASLPHTPDVIQPEPPAVDSSQPFFPAPVIEEPAASAVVGETPSPQISVDPNAVPHIALLLPLKSAAFGTAADAVQQGFLAAANIKKRALPVRIYGDYDENSSVVDVYRQAVANGARAVVGPLTRNGVAALAAEQNIPVPTLALNVVDIQPAQQLYFFGLASETEARRVAQLAKKQGLHQAIVIATRTQISQRLQFAFEEEWHASGGMILREIEFSDDPAVLADIIYTPDTVVFLAANAEKARLIRPYLSNRFPVYSTSQIFVGNDKNLTNYDLSGIRFIDMPWLLQPDHAAVMIYPRANPPLSVDRERLYALGIDAYRLVNLILANRLDTGLPLDGVSGNIRLSGKNFLREPTLAVFQQGQALMPGAASPDVPEVFPGRINAAP